MIVGISGKRQTGKTTLANILAEDTEIQHCSFARALKENCQKMFGFTFHETDGARKDIPLPEYPKDAMHGLFYTPRELMIATGQFYRRFNEDFWINKLKQTMHLTGHTVISDVRYPNEANWIKKTGGLLIRLNRNQVFTGPFLDDPSETALDSYKQFDLVVPEEYNETLEHLEETAKHIIRLIKRG